MYRDTQPSYAKQPIKSPLRQFSRGLLIKPRANSDGLNNSEGRRLPKKGKSSVGGLLTVVAAERASFVNREV